MSWTIDQARATYNIGHWSNGYFDINARGELVCRPSARPDDPGVSLAEIVRAFPRHNLSLPVLVRFSGILQHRLEELCRAFDSAMDANDYRGRYTAVYPIKVNQQRSVVDALLAHGADRLGLEAGSKPELLAVLARARADGIVVCNGYKDREFIRLALIGKALGHRVHIVVEKLAELDLVIEEARALNIAPLLGMRVRLASIGAGKWQNTGGEKSKFGLSAAEVLRVIERLRAERLLDSLQMMHFHMGSQIANIQHIQSGMREAARYYAELRRLGAKVGVINVGGGLGVDYEGTRSRSFCSMNYTVQEYATNIVHALSEICTQQRLPHPDIVSESGRALTAHHAVLITNVLDVERAPGTDPVAPAAADEPQVIQDLWRGLQDLASRPALEVYHDAVNWLSEAQTLFHHGVLNLKERARAEQIYFATCQQVRARLTPGARAHREALDELNERLADKYFCNFSLFQSMPDHWAIDQIFPVLPLTRLDEEPRRRGVLQDITCDSDGRIDLYVDGEGLETSLPLHELQCAPTLQWRDRHDAGDRGGRNMPGAVAKDAAGGQALCSAAAAGGAQTYLLGIFLVGAYQEILGDMHNLFGDTDSVHVELAPEGGFRLTQAKRGDTVDSVLRFVHFDPQDLRAAYRAKAEQAAWLTPEQRETCLAELNAGLEGYTYLED